MMDELNELLKVLVGKVKEEDLEDPQLTVLLAQLVSILQPNITLKLDEKMIAQLRQIEDKKERFVAAAQALGISDFHSLKELSNSLQANSLL